MFNPLKMHPVEKRMLIGGLASSIVYYGNLYAANNVAGYPTDLNQRASPYMPTYTQIVGSVAPPAVLYVAKKVVRSTTTKEKLGDMTLGSVLFAVPNLTHDIVVQTAYQSGVDAKGTSAALRTPLPIRSFGSASTIAIPSRSKYTIQTGSPMATGAGRSKYVLTA
jgi:hypothetical protein